MQSFAMRRHKDLRLKINCTDGGKWQDLPTGCDKNNGNKKAGAFLQPACWYHKGELI